MNNEQLISWIVQVDYMEILNVLFAPYKGTLWAN